MPNFVLPRRNFCQYSRAQGQLITLIRRFFALCVFPFTIVVPTWQKLPIARVKRMFLPFCGTLCQCFTYASRHVHFLVL